MCILLLDFKKWKKIFLFAFLNKYTHTHIQFDEDDVANLLKKRIKMKYIYNLLLPFIKLKITLNFEHREWTTHNKNKKNSSFFYIVNIYSLPWTNQRGKRERENECEHRRFIFQHERIKCKKSPKTF